MPRKQRTLNRQATTNVAILRQKTENLEIDQLEVMVDELISGHGDSELIPPKYKR